ncbi:MAG: hypothetical protein Q8O84_04670 [Nanoarchaeota archaeon]|nr:hypothetical protein [Nanoarchaeota archaeon]
MKNLKKFLLGAGLAGSLIFGTTNKSFSQDIPQEKKLLPNLNFYFETGDYKHLEGYPEFKKYVKAWLSELPKETERGNIWFYYGDTDGDGVYDYVNIDNYSSLIRSQEKFSFDFNTKKIDYALEIYDGCKGQLEDCDKIISKSYNEIDQKEAEQLGYDFFERIKEFAETSKEFSRFNPGQLEELVRKESYYMLKTDNPGKLVGNSRIPIEKLLSEEEIKKVENYPKEKKEKVERERIEQERQEKIRVEQDKIRLEKKARKPKARLKIGGGILGNGLSPTKPYFEINPQLTNKKRKGFAMGLDFFAMNSERYFDRLERDGYDEEYLNPFTSLVSERSYKYHISVISTNRFGLNLDYVSPSFEISANVGFLRRKMLIEKTAVTEEYIKVHSSKQEPSSFKTEKIISWEGEKFFGHLYGGLGGEVFPFFKKNNFSKNISFSLEGMIVAGKGNIYVPHIYVYPFYFKGGWIINAGLKYTFGKSNQKK